MITYPVDAATDTDTISLPLDVAERVTFHLEGKEDIALAPGRICAVKVILATQKPDSFMLVVDDNEVAMFSLEGLARVAALAKDTMSVARRAEPPAPGAEMKP